MEKLIFLKRIHWITKRWSSKIVNELKKESLITGEENKKLKFDVVLSNPPFAGDIRKKYN